jgi:hypothetical protein
MPDGRQMIASASHDRSVRIWSIATQVTANADANPHTFQHVRTLEYTDFVWRVFIVNSNERKPMVVAFIPTEERIQVNDLETGEHKAVFHGRLLFAGMTPMFQQGVVLTAVGEEDLSFIDVNSGAPLRTICGGFGKAFRAVVAPGITNPIVAFTTWNVQNRRSTIQTYEISPAAKPVDEEGESLFSLPLSLFQYVLVTF